MGVTAKRCAGLIFLLLAGVIAAVASTLVQVLLWLAFTDAFPAVLFRDARLTAALVLGRSVLSSPVSFDMKVMLVATVIHCLLSVVYAALLMPLAMRFTAIPAWLTGSIFGAALYLVNLYGFTLLFPWFIQTRGWITFMAHLAFGLSVAYSMRYLR